MVEMPAFEGVVTLQQASNLFITWDIHAQKDMQEGVMTKVEKLEAEGWEDWGS